MKLFSKFSVAALGLILIAAVTPGTALAGGSVHIDIPGFSIGFHDGYHNVHHRKRYRDRDYYYYDDYRPRRYYKKKYRRKYYNDYYYGGRDYYGGSDYYRKRNYDYYYPRSNEYCPTAGFSLYYQRGRDCYRHKGHYHCSY